MIPRMAGLPIYHQARSLVLGLRWCTWGSAEVVSANSSADVRDTCSSSFDVVSFLSIEIHVRSFESLLESSEGKESMSIASAEVSG